MKYIMISLTILIFTLTACVPSLDEPVNSNNPSTPQTGAYIPGPADSNLTRDTVFLDSVELLTMESFPLQFSLAIKGNLPTPCHKLRIKANQPDAENKISVEIYSLIDPNTACILVLESFEANYVVGSYPAGHYTVWVNGEQAAEFDA
jgi:hypothetical protein